MEELVRTQQLLGEAYESLRQTTVLIVGVGGVGSHAAEALARMGLGQLILVDFDELAVSNSNRHVQSLANRVGQNKAQAMKDHILGVLPEARVEVLPLRYSPETEAEIFSKKVDVVIDAIDIMTNKLQLIQACLDRRIPFISSMGMANRIDPLQVIETTVYQTKGDRFSAIIRRKARQNDWPNFPVITSLEPSRKRLIVQDEISRHVPASCYLVPAAGGIALAAWVCKEIVNSPQTE